MELIKQAVVGLNFIFEISFVLWFAIRGIMVYDIQGNLSIVTFKLGDLEISGELQNIFYGVPDLPEAIYAQTNPFQLKTNRCNRI